MTRQGLAKISTSKPDTGYRGTLPASAITELIHRTTILFLQANSWEDAAVTVLTTVGNKLQLDRISLLKQNISPQSAYSMHRLFEWHNSATVNSSDSLGQEHINLQNAVFESWQSRLDKGNPIFYSQSKTQRSKADLYLAELAVKKIMVLPVYAHNTLWGALLLESCRTGREWSQSYIHIAQKLTELFKTTITSEYNRKILKTGHINQQRELANHSQKVREDERKNLARELHDEFAQALTAIKFNIDWLQNRLKEQPDNIISCLAEISSATVAAMEKIRQTAMTLRPTIVDDLGLAKAMRWQIQKFQKRENCKYTVYAQDIKLPKEVEVAIFRIFQEALTNIIRYANANKVDVRLTRMDNVLFMQIKDDGIGFSEHLLQDTKSIGLQGMRERAMAVGGKLYIESSPSGGTTVKLYLPLKTF